MAHYDSSQLDNLMVGDEVKLCDGQYQSLSKFYCIENGKIENIYSAIIDGNRLSLDL